MLFCEHVTMSADVFQIDQTKSNQIKTPLQGLNYSAPPKGQTPGKCWVTLTHRIRHCIPPAIPILTEIPFSRLKRRVEVQGSTQSQLPPTRRQHETVLLRCTSMSAAVDVGRLAIEVTDRGRAAPKCGVASA